MAENGILDYQGMNQAIYRGATQSMSTEIGAGNSSHTSNLHIECDHAANVASIQLNSNGMRRPNHGMRTTSSRKI